MITLQNIIQRDASLPNLPMELYVRSKDGKHVFNTYFNVLNLEKIRNILSVDSLALSIRGKGFTNVRLIGSDDLIHENEIASWVFSSSTEDSVTWPIKNFKELNSKFLYLELSNPEFLDSAKISFVTESVPLHTVRLGTTIVHFNRKNWVLPAIERLKKGLLDDPEFKEKISLVIIDNSQNILKEEANGVEVIPNKNLGGSGGFTRGLLHFKTLGFSHCLFMDDDASCEVESIKRTWAFLSFLKTSNTAITGSLFMEESPSELYENGARFNRVNRALYGGYDMTSIHDLAYVETGTQDSNYGGWWFFAFPLKELSHFPFPFFVRGDDIMFSLLNEFKIVTANGVACWGDDFAVKSSPTSCYLDVRSIILNNVVSRSNSVFITLLMISKHFLLHALSFNYASASAIRLGLKHTAEKSDFWGQNVDTVEIRSKIGTFMPSEKMAPLDLSNYSFDVAKLEYHRTAKGRKLKLGFAVYAKLMLLNGALLPDFLMKKKPLLAPKGKYGSLKYAFRHREIIFYDQKSKTGYLVELDRKRLIRELSSYFWLCFKIIARSANYRNELRRAVQTYTKESYWRSIYK
jgi:galactofuranosylgalactofuranosylrhamnosyl-N-acetylglucosaminyl-diphospho-decaprenol beta-1,5/1,6-galactofuranosyltransferase